MPTTSLFYHNQQRTSQHTACFATPCLSSAQQQQRHVVLLQATKEKKNNNNDEVTTTTTTESSSSSSSYLSTSSILSIKLYAAVTIFYWYWLVLGAVGQVNEWPGIPHWLPSTPTFPPTDAELQSLLEDSYHFLYLNDVLLKNTNDPITELASQQHVVPAWRLAWFNTVEAWMFAWLPLLWKDARRWPRPILFLYWSVGCLFLTNAFLAPYLLITEFYTPSSADSFTSIATTTTTTSSETKPPPTPGKNRIVAGLFAALSTAVVVYAIGSISTTSSAGNVLESWQMAASSWWNEAQHDRTVLAYGADLAIFSIFQPLVLRRVRSCDTNSDEPMQQQQPVSDFIPFFGLVAWLLL
jgi:hypothetical protein